MSIEAVTWEEAYGGLAQMQYRFPARVKTDVEQLRRAFPDLEPYVAELPTGEVLLLMKGTLLKPTGGAGGGSPPPVNFVVTLQPPFPNSYPILTIEEPPAPWRFANHPNVDGSGQTYLSSVTNWNPQTGTIFACVNELKACLSRMPPFENAASPDVRGRPAPPPAQPLPPPRAQPVPVPMQPVPQQRVVYQQQQQPRPVYAQQTQSDSDLEAMAAVARGTLAIAGSAMGMLGMGARVLAGESPTRMIAKRAAGALWQPPQPRGTPAQQRQERMKQDFVLLITGKLNVPPGTEIITPDGFCIGRFMTSKHAIDDGLLAPGPAPLPLPPCPDPTPGDAVELAKQREHDNRERSAAAAAADTTSGAGWKALSAVGRFAGKVGSAVKNKVEDKVRERYANEDLAKFSVDFPTESQSEKLIIEYSCYCLSGDAVARKGRLYLTERAILFSGGIESPAPDAVQPPPPAVPFKFIVPLSRIVCILKGECIGKRFLHVLIDDVTFRCFTDFSASVAGKVGSLVSSSMAGTDAFDRCYNWVDHAWRAATPVPSPTYVYAGQPGPLINQPGYVPPALQPLSVLRREPAGAAPGYAAQQTPPPANGKATPPPVASPAPMPNGYNNARPQLEADLVPQAAPAAESNQCVVCMEAQRNAFFQPCGHVCCCMKCANGVGVCPMCRAKIMQVFPAYI